ncbi:50S ribosomal protein L6 [Candidatus Kuenenbacteria bacterium HGW-Kuenenbacteria-1]|uniref:Large ribosomal subunit protein uL6 n=1 Tax=Candidatus Kuenenbacteria bacterium HGW-Kuenenbacteria-1 TaxID=2013812 RepID=A0A2N1UNF7_9BACT|nr:MAG: 50S ribosomal protein L6 [Candidatus Kuenenbacteria bacterium HGW-Kuenenbacteria-1]
MSRVGKQPINISEGVDVKIENQNILIKGSKGELIQKIHPNVKIEQKDKELLINVQKPNNKKQRALWGLFQRLISNMVEGVTKGFEKKLEINGLGYKAEVVGDKLVLNVGFSHQVNFDISKNINIKVEKNVITISGFDKQLVGETAAQIRRIKKPEPYKGKGIKYVDEVVRRKAGKAAKTAGK